MTNHSSREQLLRYLDGELDSSEMRKTAAHLQQCWSCQVEFDRLKQHIALIVDAEAELFGPSLPPPPKPWPRIEPRLEKARQSGVPFWKKLFLFTPRSRMSLAYGTSVLALLFVGILVWAPVAPVSAKEMLNKAIVSDRDRQSVTLQQVVRQRVRVKKIAAGVGERTAALESWKSAKSAYWNSGANPVNTELLARYQANGLAAALPLSPAAVEYWVKIAGSEPAASSEGQHVTVQLAANPAGQARGLKKVSFHVQTDNWHMDQMTLSFADATYQIIEEASSILSRQEVPDNILAGLELVKPSPTAVPAPPVSAVAPRLTGEVTPVNLPINLDDLEIDVRYNLHRLGADLGEDIEIAVLPPDQLTINAAGASPPRKEQLKALLGNRPGIRLEFEDAVSGAPPRTAAAKKIVIPADRSSQTPDAHLSQYFSGPAVQENYTRSVLQTTTDILARVHALRELADRWPPSTDSRLSADSKTKLAAMVQEHARILGAGTSTLKKELQMILKGDQPNAQPTATGGITWQASSSSALAAASTVDRTLRALLTISDAPLSLEQALPKLHQGSSDLVRAVDELTKSLN